MPIATIQIMEGRDKAAKERLIKEVTDAICSSIGARREAVRIVLQEVPKSHWGIGGETAEALGR
ncbi:MAG: 2-hydroxymuconate tautomerase family protein [Alcanivorax sp.]|nr:2-hydroxymuconate tautomerase family protein [Alcanivorax sp.]